MPSITNLKIKGLSYDIADSFGRNNAFSGDYNDLQNTPDIPSKLSELSNDAKFVTAETISSTYATKADLEPYDKLSDIKANVDYVDNEIAKVQLEGANAKKNINALQNNFETIIETACTVKESSHYEVMQGELLENTNVQTNTSNNTVNVLSASSIYKVLELTITDQPKLKVYCSASSSSVWGAGYYCVDETGTILAQYNNTSASSISEVVEFDVPANTVKVYVNGYNITPTAQMLVIDKSYISNNVEDYVEYSYSSLDGVLQNQKNAQTSGANTVNIVDGSSNYNLLTVNITDQTRVRITCSASDNNQWGCGAYCVDKDNNILFSYNNTSSSFIVDTTEFDIPANTTTLYVNKFGSAPTAENVISNILYRSKAYARSETYSRDEVDSLILERDETVLNDISLSLFTKFGVIGDSYASGELAFNNTFIDHYPISWGQILARKSGNTCVNLSSGGLTTRTWLTAPRGLSLLNSSDALDLYIIALGINDANRLGTSYIGTVSDITDDYTGNPDTFFGNFGRIIDQVKLKSPSAKIILSTMANNDSDTYKAYNLAIIDIANHYQIPYIEQYNDSFFKSDLYLNNMYGGHPVGVTYSGMANSIERMIKKQMIDNIDYFIDFTGEI